MSEGLQPLRDELMILFSNLLYEDDRFGYIGAMSYMARDDFARDIADLVLASGLFPQPALDAMNEIALLLNVFRDFDSIEEELEPYRKRELARRCIAALPTARLVSQPPLPPGLTAEALNAIADDYELVVRYANGIPPSAPVRGPVAERIASLRAWAESLEVPQ